MLVGASVADITPDWPVELGGFIARVQPSIGVHDPIRARALCLASEDGTEVIWLHAECLGFDAAFVTQVRARLARRFGVAQESVCLTATHNHSAAATITLLLTGHQDARYMAWLEDKLCELAELARARMESCRLLATTGTCTLGVERRRDDRAPVDPAVTITAFEGEGGQLVALVANYAVHNVALGHENRFISSDIHGHAATWLEHHLPGEPVCVMLPGACANINPPGEGTDFGFAEQWGGTLGDAVATALRDAREDPPRLSAQLMTVPVPLEVLDDDALSERASGLRARMGDGSTYASARAREAVSIWESHMRSRTQSPSASLEVQIVRVGTTRYACIGAEVFSHMTTAAPSVCPVGCANSVFGYLAPTYTYDEGGYEVDVAYLFYDTQRLLPGGFETVAARIEQAVSG